MKKNMLSPLALISQIGIAILSPIFVCVFIGIKLDEFCNTGGIFFAVFLIAGILAGFRNLFSLTQKYWEGKKNE